LRTTLKGLREDYRDIFDLIQPHLYFAEYVSLMQERLESDVDESTISDHEIDRKQMFNDSEVQVARLDLSQSKTEYHIKRAVVNAIFPTLTVIYDTFAKSIPIWYHGCSLKQYNFMQRAGVRLTTLQLEARSLDATAAFYFTKHFEYALFRSLAKYIPDSGFSYIICNRKPDEQTDAIAGLLDLRNDIDQLKQCIQFNRKCFYHASAEAEQKWIPPSATIIRGFVPSRKPPRPDACRSEYQTKGAQVRCDYIQNNVEQICFLEEAALQRFCADQLGIIEIKVPEKLQLKELQKWAGTRAYSVSVLRELVG